jgi:hypothetical protein
MREIRLVAPELGLIAATRGILGVGIGLLLASRFKRHRRRAVGIALTALGALSTIPLALRMVQRHRTSNGVPTSSVFAT